MTLRLAEESATLETSVVPLLTCITHLRFLLRVEKTNHVKPLQNDTGHGRIRTLIERVVLTCSIHYPADDLPERRGARAAESGSLENCCRGNSTVGSNPTLSATANFYTRAI